MLRCASHYCCHPEDVISPETVWPFDDRLFKSVSHRSIDPLMLVVVVVGACLLGEGGSWLLKGSLKARGAKEAPSTERGTSEVI